MEARPQNTHCHLINVTWGDCDPARIVYTGRIPNFALDAINSWWEAQLGGDGWFQMEIDRNVGTPFVRLETDFRHPVTPRHVLVCHVWPVSIGRTSIAFRVDWVQDAMTCFSTRAINVFTVASEFRKQPPPVEIRAMVEKSIANQVLE